MSGRSFRISRFSFCGPADGPATEDDLGTVGGIDEDAIPIEDDGLALDGGTRGCLTRCGCQTELEVFLRNMSTALQIHAPFVLLSGAFAEPFRKRADCVPECGGVYEIDK